MVAAELPIEGRFGDDVMADLSREIVGSRDVPVTNERVVALGGNPLRPMNK